MRTRILSLVFVLVSTLASFAQPHSLLYEVSGNGLNKSSYLFGTFHLLTESFVDSQKVVMKKLDACKAVAGEVITDSLMAYSATMLLALKTDTPLDKLLSPSTYVELNSWTYDLLGMDLTFFKNMPPALVNAMLMQMEYTKNFNPPSGEKLMDVYIQDYAKKKKKEVYGLETIETQVNALFNRPLKRQADQLEEFMSEKDSIVQQLQQLLSLYRRADFDKLLHAMYEEEGFTQDEINGLLVDRNNAWLRKLPAMMKEQPTFIAVGAMHLAGENGLVAGLRKQGYTVTPLPLR